MGNVRSSIKELTPDKIFKPQARCASVSEDNSNLANSSSKNDLSELDDVLVHILSFMSVEDLIFNCRFVCKEWKEIIDGNGLWKIKCKRENRCIPSAILNPIPQHYYRKIYIFNPFGRNLVYNPCGKDQFDGWMLRSIDDGDGFKVEDPPQGSDPVPKEVGSQSCFVTSYEWCIKCQLVDLIRRGVPKEILKLETTKVEVGEWYAARSDCAAEYKLDVSLLFLQRAIDPPKPPHDVFDHTDTIKQGKGKQWHKVSHTFQNLGESRCVCFQHSAKDLEKKKGHYGMKMTGSYVKVIA
ncbi:hypothetical protein JTE90_029352 [Oedothorax gibbosus]|uniref:FBA domain-containing protein n=1 Tax=Oedothorax gibbosus TaxID=931172 RepID=A0AAV6UD27_9ARAC|nr:hypothetical protein JTE90_029352 [Oedothorax gibbosus]